jgi:predicted RNase H-like HicB family nuclease
MSTAHEAETITIPLAVTLTVVAVKEADGGYSIAIPALPGCLSEADNEGDIARQIRDAAEGWLQCQHEKNLPEVMDSFTGGDS